MRQRRRRSAAITLVLAGTITGCSEPVPQRDVYLSRLQCEQDWSTAQCQPATQPGHSRDWFYGPSYYGSAWPSGRPRASQHALEAFHAPGTQVARSGTTTSTRSSTSSSTLRSTSPSSSSSRSSSSSSTSRGGFGSSGYSSGG